MLGIKCSIIYLSVISRIPTPTDYKTQPTNNVRIYSKKREELGSENDLNEVMESGIENKKFE